MQRFRIVTDEDEPTDAIKPEDLERVSRAVEKLTSLVNDPIALIDRARGLLDGTAEKIEGLV